VSNLDNISVLILAGQREGVIDPLCEMAGIERKALLPVRGIPQIDRVAHALDGAGLLRPFATSGLGQHRDGFSTATSGDGPADSAWLALQNASFPVVLTTADHPLLTSEMVMDFIARARAVGADFCIGLATKETISAAYPHTKRTYFKFSDVSISGCNLFWIANKDGLKAIQFWRRAQSYRKRPIKLAAQFGPAMILQYLFGQLSLQGAFAFASRKLGITAAPVLLPFAEAAIDLDKPSDLTLIEQILDARDAA